MKPGHTEIGELSERYGMTTVLLVLGLVLGGALSLVAFKSLVTNEDVDEQ